MQLKGIDVTPEEVRSFQKFATTMEGSKVLEKLLMKWTVQVEKLLHEPSFSDTYMRYHQGMSNMVQEVDTTLRVFATVDVSSMDEEGNDEIEEEEPDVRLS